MLSEKNRILVEVVDGWAIGEECNLPLDRIEALMNAAREEEAKAVSVEGWKLVPVEPTSEMMEAGLSQWSNLQDMYEAMLAASPQPPRDERPVAQCGGDAIAAMLEEDPFTIAPYRQAVGTTAALAMDAHRGWSIDEPVPGIWIATSPDYDASYEGPEDGWVDNGEKVEARSRAALIEEIDAFIEEGEEAERAYERQDHED